MIPEVRGTGVAGAGTVLDVASQSTVQQRTIQNLPLEPVDMSVPVTESDFEPGKPWPPRRLRARNDRLKIYRDLWAGDWRYFVADPAATRVQINYFRRVPEVLSALMASTGLPPGLTDPAMSGISEMLIAGRAHTIALGEQRFVPRSEFTFEHEDAETLYVVTPEVTTRSEDGRQDALTISAIGKGKAETWISEFHGEGAYGTIGEAGPSISSAGTWSHADRPPVEHSQWGQSLFETLIGPVIGIALRLSGSEDVLAKHQRPLLWVNSSLNDVTRALSLDETADIADFGYGEVQRSVQRLLDQDVLWQESDAMEPKYLVPEYDVTGAALQIELLKGELRMLTGLVSALEHEGGDLPSGRALQQMMMVLFWTASQLHERLHDAMQETYGAFEWRSPFDVDEAEEMATEDGDGESDDEDPEDGDDAAE